MRKNLDFPEMLYCAAKTIWREFYSQNSNMEERCLLMMPFT